MVSVAPWWHDAYGAECVHVESSLLKEGVDGVKLGSFGILAHNGIIFQKEDGFVVADTTSVLARRPVRVNNVEVALLRTLRLRTPLASSMIDLHHGCPRKLT